MRKAKYLPSLMHAHETLEKIRTKIHSVARATNEQLELVQQVMDQWYTPTITGTEMDFYDCEMDQYQSKHLGIDPISDFLIMTAALWVLSKERHGGQLQRMVKTQEFANTNANSPQDDINQFKGHCNRRLTDLYNHNHNASTAASNHAFAVVGAIAKHNDRTNGSTIQSKATDCLVLNSLPDNARACHKFDEVHLPLISVPTICAHGCKVNFGPTTVTVTQDGQQLLTGTRDPKHNLHMVLLHDSAHPLLTSVHSHSNYMATATTAYEITRTAQQIVFLHANVRYPTGRTFLQTIQWN